MATLVTVFNTPRVVLAGSVARFGQPLLQAVVAEMHQRMLGTLVDRATVTISGLGDEIIMLGAAALPLANELGVV